MPGGPADPTVISWAPVEGPAARYRDLKLRLAGMTAAALLRLFQHMQSGALTDDEVATMGATSIVGANTQAATLADLYLAHVLDKPPLGLSVPPDTGRLELAMRTAVSDVGTNPTDALTRLGRSEPLRTAQTSLQTGMKRHQVSGWTRVTGGTPCQMCADLADGTVLSPDTEMLTHNGCSCVQQIVSGD
jgi:hypothetical protein